ncbi:Gfo/Idh/MocA family oxidoreductase [Pendulispora brunnea]|uniref:Gfo/Idh/MocA family oxidoreductase n=1 Tax=Pendulispora brunnea TaxID=2905690 RepID=A0ABZ2KNP0_9BACT
MSLVVLVLGTGSIGMRHLQVLSEIEGIRAVAVPARAERVDELATQGHAALALEDALALGPTAAIVATDTGRHVKDAALLLRHGCHVLIEKPLAPTAHGIARLAEIAEAEKRTVAVGCYLRFHPALALFKELLGEIGDVHHVSVACQSYLPEWRANVDHRRTYAARAEEGGVLRDLVHEIDYATWLFGRPLEVSAMLTAGDSLGIASDAAADLLWRTAGGATVATRLDYLTRVRRRCIEAFGRKGEIAWDAVANTVTVRTNGAEDRVNHVGCERNTMMREQILALLACARKEPFDARLTSFDDGAFAIALCDAARASSASGQVQPVRDWRKG